MTSPHRKFALFSFVCLLLFAAAARLLTFDRFLPLIDHVDEPNMWILGQAWRSIPSAPSITTWLTGYPPLYVWINAGVQQILELLARPGLMPSDYLYAARLLAALSGIVTTALVMCSGRILAGTTAGFFAGLVWALSPILVIDNNWAIPDPILYLTCALAIATALQAWQKRSPAWAFASLAAGIPSVYLKYSAVFALVPWAVVMVGLIRHRPPRFWRWLIAQGVVILGSAGYLVVGYGAFRLANTEATTVRSQGLTLMLDLSRNLNNASYALLPVGSVFFGAIMLLATAAFFINRRRRRRLINLRMVGLLAVYSVAALLVSASFAYVHDTLEMRHTLPITVALAILWGGGIAQIGWALDERAQRRLAVALIGVIVGLPMLISTAQNIYTFSLPDTRLLLQKWTDANIPADGMILMVSGTNLERIWDRTFGGFNGAKPFHWWFEQDPGQSTPRDFYTRGMMYFAMSDTDRQQYLDTGDNAAFLRQLTLIKTIPAGPKVASSTLYFYRLIPPTVTTQVTFGKMIDLVGYDLSPATPVVKPGQTIHFRPYWHAGQQPTDNYSMFLHLQPDNRSDLVAQFDGAPSTPERPTLTWDDPNELYIGPDAPLTIPANTAPGSYRLVIGLYNYDTGQRLLTGAGTDSAQIVTLTVQ